MFTLDRAVSGSSDATPLHYCVNGSQASLPDRGTVEPVVPAAAEGDTIPRLFVPVPNDLNT